MNKGNYFSHESSYIAMTALIGDGTKIWHFSHIDDEANIGSNCTIGQNVYIGKSVFVGDNVKIQNNVSVYQGVTLNDYVFCGPSVVFTNDLTPRSAHPIEPSEYKSTFVGYGTTIEQTQQCYAALKLEDLLLLERVVLS
jgi:UDP-2-acetamido-3-amino-2,3-dideoxy-glucuronate N-acetyltransferase